MGSSHCGGAGERIAQQPLADASSRSRETRAAVKACLFCVLRLPIWSQGALTSSASLSQSCREHCLSILKVNMWTVNVNLFVASACFFTFWFTPPSLVGLCPSKLDSIVSPNLSHWSSHPRPAHRSAVRRGRKSARTTTQNTATGRGEQLVLRKAKSGGGGEDMGREEEADEVTEGNIRLKFCCTTGGMRNGFLWV